MPSAILPRMPFKSGLLLQRAIFMIVLKMCLMLLRKPLKYGKAVDTA
jgi:hypothetical protein